MKSLIVKGPFTGATGYDHHVREFTKEIVNRGVAVQLLDLPQWSKHKLATAQRGQEHEALNRPVDAKIMLHFAMPHQVQKAPDLLNVNFTMFEATAIPSDWLEHNLTHDGVIVPTVSSKQAWIDSGYPKQRIHLCPLGVDSTRYHPEAEPMALTDGEGRPIREYGTRVLNISELTPRKNLVSLLRVWIQNTSRSDDAILILKLNCPWRRWLYKFLFDLKLMERRIGKSRRRAAPILFLINRRFSVDEMPRLYATATHYWSMSHGEGWDLCMMEAGASGLHLIAPDHSAYATYLDASVADMVPSETVPATFRWAYGMQKYFKGAHWWRPNESVAGDILHAILRNGATKGHAARGRIVREYSWTNATTHLIEILGNLLC